MRKILPLLLFASQIVIACNGRSGADCAPDDYRYCPCSDGKRGYQQCRDDGEGYGSCDCSGTIPAGAGVLVGDQPVVDAGPKEASALAGFLEPCVTNDQCETKLCFPFNAYGPHCSTPCQKDSDCPAPSPGCSNKNACKIH